MQYDIELALRHSDFELALAFESDARCVGLFGPSGSGKTTALELVAGWRRAQRGHVRIAGQTLFDAARGVSVPARERRLGYVPQDLLLFPHWNVRQNLLAGAPRPAGALFEEVVAVLELGSLLEREHPKH